jgi:hypothetical protein
MNSNQLVLKVLRVLEKHDVDYMVVGSLSSNAYGIARSTKDADFVIELGDRSIAPVSADLLPELKLDPQMVLESVTLTSRFIARTDDSAFKIELFLLTNDPHDQARFTRRQSQPFLEATAMLPTPEDVVIQKLRWFGRIRRAKDLDDCRNVLAVSRPLLNLDYIRGWCDQHGTREQFEKLLLETDGFDDAPSSKAARD